MAYAKSLFSVLKSYFLKMDSPFIANWIITSQCNCKCPFCELGVKNIYDPKKELSTERCFELIQELKKMRIKFLTLSGGEVFLRKDIWKILEKLKQAEIKTAIVTNGLMLNSFSKSRIKFLKNNLDSLIISLDSTIPKEHNKFRGMPKLFQLIMKGIEKFQKNGYTNIVFESIIMRQNYKQIPELIKLTKQKRIKKIMFRPINIISNFPNLSHSPNKDKFANYNVNEIIRYIDTGIKVAKKLAVDTDLFFNKRWLIEYFKNLNIKKGFFHDRVMGNYFCFIPFIYIIINYNGDLLPCLLLKGKGNIMKNKLELERNKSNSIRKRLAKRDFFEVCNCCFDQANNNVRFSTLCNPFRNLKSIKSMIFDIISVKKRYTN